MQITTTIEQTRGDLGSWDDVALVPTMGALHEGHLSLVRQARTLCRRVVVSIFVNPTQFGEGEDLEAYPRPLDADLDKCRAEGVDLVFNPSVETMYAPNEGEVGIELPGLTDILEGEHRPGHFPGVCLVVLKLLQIVRPQVACFGEKDYQQLRVIEALATALFLPVRIEACPTIRNPDGLALSSRNAYLGAKQRKQALALSKSLELAARLIESGEVDPTVVERAMAEELKMHAVEVDYAVVRDARTLGEVQMLNPSLEPLVALVAGKVDGIRLIDSRRISSS